MASRFDRYSGIFDLERLATTPVAIIGVGAIGRQVALGLATMGVKNITLYDGDTVGPENMGVQGYRPDQLEMPKVVATAKDLELILADAPGVEITAVEAMYGGESPQHEVIFSCVDSMDARKTIYERNQFNCKILVDGRMAAEACNIITYQQSDNFDYSTTLFSEAEAYQAPCTQKSTFYCASIASGLMIGNYAKFLRNMIIEQNFSLNIFATELFREPPIENLCTTASVVGDQATA